MRRLVLLLALLATAGCGAVPLPFRTTLQRNPATQTVEYVSQQQAYERLKKITKDTPEFQKLLRPEDAFASYRVRLTDRDKSQQVIASVRGMPGVYRASLQPTPRPS